MQGPPVPLCKGDDTQLRARTASPTFCTCAWHCMHAHEGREVNLFLLEAVPTLCILLRI